MLHTMMSIEKSGDFSFFGFCRFELENNYRNLVSCPVLENVNQCVV